MKEVMKPIADRIFMQIDRVWNVCENAKSLGGLGRKRLRIADKIKDKADRVKLKERSNITNITK